MLFVGDDWAEAHHDIEMRNAQGRRLVRQRLPEGVDGISALHALVADHLADSDEPEDVVVGIENPTAARGSRRCSPPVTPSTRSTRCRQPATGERLGTSGVKSDPGDAHVLAELVRTDRDHHRPIAGVVCL